MLFSHGTVMITKLQIPHYTVPINCCLANMTYTILVKEDKTTLEHTVWQVEDIYSFDFIRL